MARKLRPIRDVSDLEREACRFWPTVLAEREQTASIIPRLIETQDKFIGILHVADKSPTAWMDVLEVTREMPANLFLKHLMVLTDLGGEPLKRLRTSLSTFFPDGKMSFTWREKSYTHQFASLDDDTAWTNKRLGVDGRGLTRTLDLSSLIIDVAMLLLHGGTCTSATVPDVVIDKCTLGSLLGSKRLLDSFIRERYIHVSRITGGAKANSLGHLCQAYVREHLKNALPDWDFSRTTIPGISQNAGRTNMSFDLVGRGKSKTCCAIEVSFQFTTNSTIERKGGQAEARQRLLHAHGHRIAYVIDGAGNFERRSILATICAHSDCTVTFKDRELDRLADYLESLDG